MQEAQILSLGWEDALEEEMVTHSRTLGLENPMDRGAQQATRGCKELDVTERLDTTCTQH